MIKTKLSLLCFAIACVTSLPHRLKLSVSEDHRDEIHHDDDEHTSTMTKQIEALLRNHAYEMSVRPESDGGPVRVGVAVLIESISDISEVNMDLTFTLLIWKSWEDRRLQLEGEHESVVLPSRLIDKLWVPDLFIVGSKKSFIHRTTIDNIMLRLFKNGTISYRAKITTTVACQMNLYNFPLDIENCTLSMQSLAHTSEELLLEWWMGETNADLFMNPKLVSNMPKFRLVHHKLHADNLTSARGDRISQLRVSFELQRYLLSVFFQSYFPAIIMVILAGLGLWLDPRSVPARVAMGITSVLTISTIITGLKSTLPKVSYLTAMDLYLWICFLFVFSTVLEYCILNFFMTREMHRTHKQERGDEKMKTPITSNRIYKELVTKLVKELPHRNGERSSFGSSYSNTGNDDLEIYLKALSILTQQSPYTPRNDSLTRGGRVIESKYSPGRRSCSKISIKLGENVKSIDVFFRIFYFFSFITFNVIYWSYYIISTQHGLKEIAD